MGVAGDSTVQPTLKVRTAHLPAWIRFGVTVLAVLFGLGLVVVLARSIEPPAFRSRFSRAETRKLQRERPNVVLIGNSMVLTRFHPPTLQALLAPRRATLLAYNGAASAVWYLLLKNYVAPMKRRPDRVVIFFRSDELTEPRLRTTGKYQSRIESFMPAPDPQLQRRLTPGLERWSARLAYTLAESAPLHRLRPQVQEPITRFSHGLTGLFANGLDQEAQSQQVNDVFALAQLRSRAEPPDPGFNADFPAAVENSLLPDMIAIAKERALPLTFVRIPQPLLPQDETEKTRLAGYLAQLEKYLQRHGVKYWDMQDASWETAEMHLDESGHLKRQELRRYTQLFVEHLPHVLE